MARENTTTAVRRGLSQEALNLWAECKVCFFRTLKSRICSPQGERGLSGGMGFKKKLSFGMFRLFEGI